MSVLLSDNTLTLNAKVQVDNQGYSLQNIDWIELQNASPFACHVQIGNAQLLLPAWYDMPILTCSYGQAGRRVLPGLSLPFTVLPYLQTIPGSGFTQTLHTILYMNGETPANTQPGPLGGGPVDLTLATQVSNTTFPAGTVIVFGAPVNDSDVRGATNIENNGQIILGDNNYAGQFTLRTSTPATNVQNANQMVMTDAAGIATVQVVAANPPTITLQNDSLVQTVIQAALASQFGGGVNTNTIRDNTNGNTALDLSLGTGEVKFPQTIHPTGSTQVNGSAGSYTKAFPFWDSGGKLMIVTVGGYTNASTSTITFPSTMGRGLFFIFGLGGMSFTLSSGSVAVVLTLGTASAAGTEAGASTIRGDSMGYIATGVSGIVLSAGTTQNGCIVFVGN